MPDEGTGKSRIPGWFYLRCLLSVLGAKGSVILLGIPFVYYFSAQNVHHGITSGILTATFGYALILDSEPHAKKLNPDSDVRIRSDYRPLERIDLMGLTVLLLSFGYFVVAVVNVIDFWIPAAVAALVVVGVVAYDYISETESEDASEALIEGTTEEDILSFDGVGVALGIVLLLYSVVVGVGLGGFAHSAMFVVLVFVFYTGTVLAFAAYAVATTEFVNEGSSFIRG